MTRNELIKKIDSVYKNTFDTKDRLIWENDNPVDLKLTQENFANTIALACHFDMPSIIKSVSGVVFKNINPKIDGIRLFVEFPSRLLDGIDVSNCICKIRKEFGKIEKRCKKCIASCYFESDVFYFEVEYPFI